ncbi:MAG: IniB N-terminal domain-containing protein [Gordonia sp. (in: high G+C Gram-positive bacteria)]
MSATSLLDFVLSLTGDPAAAAAYAEDPQAALAAAGLEGVAPADIDALLPLAAGPAAPAGGLFGAVDHGSGANAQTSVWAGSDVASAFDLVDQPADQSAHGPGFTGDPAFDAAPGGFADAPSTHHAVAADDVSGADLAGIDGLLGVGDPMMTGAESVGLPTASHFAEVPGVDGPASGDLGGYEHHYGDPTDLDHHADFPVSTESAFGDLPDLA